MSLIYRYLYTLFFLRYFHFFIYSVVLLIGNCLYAAEQRINTTTIDSLPQLNSDNKKSDHSELHLFVGETRLLKASGIHRVAVGSNHMLNANVINDQEILLSANHPGVTTLALWKHNAPTHQISVYILPNETVKTQREVVDFIAGIPGAQAKIVGDKVIIEGENLSDSDQEKIAEIAKRYPQVINFTNRIGWEKMILIDVRVAEFPSTTLRDIGVQWDGLAQGGMKAGINWGTHSEHRVGPLAFFSINAHLLSQLHFLAQKGEAAILAEPKLSTRNGSTAVFFAGGEIPYQISEERDRRSVMFKPYGVKLEVQPRVDRNGVIRAIIETEVSSIDASLETLSGPALRSRRTKAEFNLHDGQTILLSGFLTREQIRNQQKLPLLGDLPILGALFRSEKFQHRETELVIFVTPYITDAKHAYHAQQLQDSNTKLEKTFGPLQNTPSVQSESTP